MEEWGYETGLGGLRPAHDGGPRTKAEIDGALRKLRKHFELKVWTTQWHRSRWQQTAQIGLSPAATLRRRRTGGARPPSAHQEDPSWSGAMEPQGSDPG